MADTEVAPTAKKKVLDPKVVEHEFKKMGGGGEKIKTTSVANLCHALGLAPSQMEVRALRERVGEECDLNTFRTFAAEVAHPEDSSDSLLPLFKSFDPLGSGNVSVKVMKNILQNFGEPLPEKEVDEMIQEIGAKEDKINYKEFLDRLLEI